MKPTIGRIVIYNTSDVDKEKMKAVNLLNGNCNVQDKLPAVITAVWGDECVNLKVIVDGCFDLWVTSALKGDNPMNWNWPVIE